MKHAKRKLKRLDAAKVVAGIAWYSSEQWTDLRRVASDPEELESTYEEWLAVISRSVPGLIKKGMNLVKVPVDVRELVSWCEHRGKRIDAHARAQYVVEMLRQRGASSFERLTTQI